MPKAAKTHATKMFTVDFCTAVSQKTALRSKIPTAKINLEQQKTTPAKEGVFSYVPKFLTFETMKFQLKTKNDFPLFEVTSALQKSIRRGLEVDAMYWAMEMEEKYHQYLWKRLTVIASEDVGMADNQIAVLISSLKANYEEAKKKDRDERLLFVSHAILALCRSKKSREVDEFIHHYFINHTNLYKTPEKMSIPDFAYDKHTSKGKRLGRGMAHFWTEGATLINEVKGSKYKEFVTEFYKTDPKPQKEEDVQEEKQNTLFE